MSSVFISLGSNLGDKEANLASARSHITKHVGKVLQKSSIYSTKPWGYNSFNNYLNQVVEANTAQPADVVMKNLLLIENELGRKRNKVSYEDRTIDLDILFFEDLIVNSDSVTIPHPRLHERLFVLDPLVEIAPDFMHPVFGKNLTQLRKELISKE